MSKSRKDLLFTKKKKIPDRLSCSICIEILSTPIILNCKHSFCHDCISNWINNGKECPLCRKKINKSELKESKNLEEEIQNLEVFCKFINCPWTGPLRQLETHEALCTFSPSRAEKKILDLLPKYSKDEEENFTPCISLITTLYQDFPKLAKRILSDSPKEVKKGKSKLIEKSFFQKTLDDFLE
jgi:hypothetical protein